MSDRPVPRGPPFDLQGGDPPDAVVLAAGRGERLRPLTDSLPKVLVPIGGKPMLAFHLEALRSAGIRRVVIVVGYRSEQVRAYVGDGRTFGLEARFLEQGPPRGTGDALRAARGTLRSDWIVVCYGDVFLPDESALLHRFLIDRAPKIAGAWVPNAGTLGRLTTVERDGRTVLTGIREKDGQPTPGLVNAGIYLLPHHILDLADQLPLSPRGEYELTDAVLAFATREAAIEVVKVDSWLDIADPTKLAEAELLARSIPAPRSASAEHS
jgi:UDP-N-acetylglucosamine diphosphorylase / glucose-1-phosphate thymidylyltransferase / UDP-N-acetylgalactosamine diphosphorylase / glucosamine-1-phosphate N-acetyltransferase / galactosamine-1-phosphate N-acetyltransferase